MLDQLRQQRRELLDRYDLGGVYDDIAAQLDEVVEQERDGIDRRVDEARQSGDQRRQEMLEELAQQRRRELDELPPDLAGRVQELQQYDFMDDAARQRFEELMDELRSQLLDNMFNQMSEGMPQMSPEQMARMKDMLAELNQMLEQRERGEEPDFAGFMERYGDFFPGNPQTLDELLEQMARSMAAMQQMLNSMTPEQRAQLQQLAESLLEDMDLRWQMDELSRNLQQAFPQHGLGPADELPRRRADAARRQVLGCSTSSATSTPSRTCCATRPSPASSPRSTSTRRATCSATTPRRSLERLAELAKMLEEAGLIEQREGRLRAHGQGRARASASRRSATCSASCCRTGPGRHEIERAGVGHERAYEHKPYEFGDPFHLNVEQTVRNAITRQGSGTPVRLSPDDFEVERTEVLTRSATVLMLDVSLSMPMRGNFLPAKKVAMALHALITTPVPARLLRPRVVRPGRPRGEAASCCPR